MVNSKWTSEHIARLWLRASYPVLVYPPCNVTQLAALPLDRKLKSLYLVSLAQFRPEKNHAKQLRAFAAARERASAEWTHSSEAVLAARLKLIGSCRNQGDEQRVAHLVSLNPISSPSKAVAFSLFYAVFLKPCPSEDVTYYCGEQRELAHGLKVAECVDFCVNAPFQDVQQLLAGAVGGLHTMLDEHFGISIVEYMAAGNSCLLQVVS